MADCQSRFIELFGDPVSNPKDWNVEALGKRCRIITGNTPPRSEPDNYGEYIEWIKSDNINTPFTFITEAQERLSETGFEKCRFVEAGSILMTCIAGSINCIGNVAVTNRRVAFNQQINAIVPEQDEVLYLYWLMQLSNLEKMLLPDNIIEHLDNNGLNCSYDNLHILSSDRNKGKAFLIDKEADKFHGIPLFITDVFYSHNRRYYQMQITFNYDLRFDVRGLRPIHIETFFFQYDSFNNLFIDWMYVFECRESGVVDIRKFHADRVFAKNRPQIVIKPEEQDYVIIQRDGQYYLRLCTDPGKGLSIILKTGYTDLENIESPPKN